jgi:hypothetical protein
MGRDLRELIQRRLQILDDLGGDDLGCSRRSGFVFGMKCWLVRSYRGSGVADAKRLAC